MVEADAQAVQPLQASVQRNFRARKLAEFREPILDFFTLLIVQETTRAVL
jgi:hypothetical protein